MFYDIIIFIGTLGPLLLLYFLWFTKVRSNKKLKLHKKKLILISTLVGLTWCFLFWGSFIEPRIITINHQTINLSDTPQKKVVTIALVSDLHFGPFKTETFAQHIVQKLNNLNFDALLLTGDYISGNEKAAMHLSPVKTISEKIPTYAVWGNHDFNVGSRNDKVRDDTNTSRKVFNELDIQILENEHLLIHTQHDDFWLLGIDSILADRDDIVKAFEGLSPQDTRPKIVLAHNPDILFDITKYYIPVDAILTGHTHGGQIRLPLIGSLAHIPVYVNQKYDKGLFDYKGYPLVITSGVGETGTRARLFNPPEIMIIDIWK